MAIAGIGQRRVTPRLTGEPKASQTAGTDLTIRRTCMIGMACRGADPAYRLTVIAG
jgi:hypothetical protein